MNKYNNIPVNIITGFLGSGKTTAIIHLLKQKSENEQWAVLINEFGKVSVDFETLSPKASENEKVFEISGGCICCSAKDNFRQNLNEIIAQKRFDRIIIEPSGLGGADMVSEIIREQENLELKPIIALVSTDYLEIKKLQINPIFRNQLLNANILILSKCDLENDEQKLEQAITKLKSEYPNKLRYAKSRFGEIDSCLLNTSTKKEERSKFDQFFFSEVDTQDDNYESKSFVFDSSVCIDTNKVIRVLEENEGVVRAKGYLKTLQGWRFLNFTMGASFVEESDSKDESKLVVISEKNKNILSKSSFF